MSDKVKNKRILKEITLRFIKGMLEQTELLPAFLPSIEKGLLSMDEIRYMDEKLMEFSEKITPKEGAKITNELIEEYFDFE